MGIYDFKIAGIKGNNISFDRYKGKVLLIVNTASKCGFTPQLQDLEKLYQQYKESAFEVLGFPCNQFDNQEPGTNKEINTFCGINYGVKFQLFDKIDVRGAESHPLFKYLISEAKYEGIDTNVPMGKLLHRILKENYPDYLLDDSIKWNFTKFLIDREGNVVKRYESPVEPLNIKEDIEKLL